MTCKKGETYLNMRLLFAVWNKWRQSRPEIFLSVQLSSVFSFCHAVSRKCRFTQVTGWELWQFSDGLEAMQLFYCEVFPLKMFYRRASIVLTSIIRTAAGTKKLPYTLELLVCLCLERQPPVGQGLLIHEICRSHTTTHHNR